MPAVENWRFPFQAHWPSNECHMPFGVEKRLLYLTTAGHRTAFTRYQAQCSSPQTFTCAFVPVCDLITEAAASPLRGTHKNKPGCECMPRLAVKLNTRAEQRTVTRLVNGTQKGGKCRKRSVGLSTPDRSLAGFTISASSFVAVA